MDFDVLPGPTPAELARTAMARATAATVRCDGARQGALATAPVRADSAGHPVLLAAAESALARLLGAGPVTVTVTVPATAPFSALRLTGAAAPPPAAARSAPVPAHGGAGSEPAAATRYPVALRSVELAGAIPARIVLAEYEAATPDPLWREAPAVLHHLEDRHMADLVACIRAHGMQAAEWVIPQGLDRFGLELLVLAGTGLADVRLSFPNGPVTALAQVPASIRALLTCHCAGKSPRRKPRA